MKRMIEYNPVSDVVYITLKKGAFAYGDEQSEDFVVMRDFETDEITGYQILFASEQDFNTPEYEIIRDCIPKIEQILRGKNEV